MLLSRPFGNKRYHCKRLETAKAPKEECSNCDKMLHQSTIYRHKTEEKSFEHYDIPVKTWDASQKELLSLTKKLKANRYAFVSGVSGKPTYVDIPKELADGVKRMEPQDVAHILLSKEM